MYYILLIIQTYQYSGKYIINFNGHVHCTLYNVHIPTIHMKLMCNSGRDRDHLHDHVHQRVRDEDHRLRLYPAPGM